MKLADESSSGSGAGGGDMGHGSVGKIKQDWQQIDTFVHGDTKENIGFEAMEMVKENSIDSVAVDGYAGNGSNRLKEMLVNIPVHQEILCNCLTVVKLVHPTCLQ